MNRMTRQMGQGLDATCISSSLLTYLGMGRERVRHQWRIWPSVTLYVSSL